MYGVICDKLSKNFSNESFRSEFVQLNRRYHDFYFFDFNSMFLVVLNKHRSIKKRYIRANKKNFMDKELNQAIMVRSKLSNKFL